MIVISKTTNIRTRIAFVQDFILNTSTVVQYEYLSIVMPVPVHVFVLYSDCKV